MSRMYFILTVAGWAWLVVVAVFLVIRLTIMRKSAQRGFDVVDHTGAPEAVQRKANVREQ